MRSQSRFFPAGPEITLYTAPIIEFIEFTSVGFAAAATVLPAFLVWGSRLVVEKVFDPVPW
ncbi:MAG: hypothetical protein ABI923_13055 [bacterium]